MSRTIFRGTSPNGATEREVMVADGTGTAICIEMRKQDGTSMGATYLDLDMADALGRHIRDRVHDARMELEATT